LSARRTGGEAAVPLASALQQRARFSTEDLQLQIVFDVRITVPLIGSSVPGQ
jgi:hypothetical protein